MRKIATTALALLLLSACAGGEESPSGPTDDPRTTTSGEAPLGDTGSAPQHAPRSDPREGGLEVGLGEWALTLEAGAIRPGRVTFVVANRGTIGHGFEIELEGEDDSSGSGSGDEDGIKAETNLLQPGDRTELTLDLAPGLYKVECLVDGHDDLGMEGFLEVRANAPLVRTETASADSIAIETFAFDPPELRVVVGTEVTWTNEDPTQHTVTATDGAFDSGVLDQGQSFSFTVETNGPVTYACVIHPDMTGTLVGT
jgi:plastocyanin